MQSTEKDKMTQLANRYMEVWNQTDADLRRQAISGLWTEDGVQFLSSMIYRGHTELETRVREAHEEFVKKDGNIFVISEAQSHNQALKLTWNMVPASGGEVLATGQVFLLLSDDGRIHSDYQF